MNAYSKDLRIRVLEALERGQSRREICQLFQSLPLYHQTLGEEGSRAGEDLEPRHSTGRKRRILATLEEKRALWEQLEENDAVTLERHCELWEKERGVRVSIARMSRAIREKLGWTLKKRRWVPPSEMKKREVLSGSV